MNIFKLKKDYLNFILSWLDKGPRGLIKAKLIAPKTMKEIAGLLPIDKSKKPGFTVKWDNDADRVFFYDEKNRKIPAYFMTALLAKIIQEKNPKAKIVHDERLKWAIDETVKNTYTCPAGWSNFLRFMQKNNIDFGGEASGHYYFNKKGLVLNDGLVPVLLINQHLIKTGERLSELINPYRKKYFISGEMNLRRKISLEKIEKQYQNSKISHLDGLSVEYPDWRFNLRRAQTEDLWRLNLEARAREALKNKIQELCWRL